MEMENEELAHVTMEAEMAQGLPSICELETQERLSETEDLRAVEPATQTPA